MMPHPALILQASAHGTPADKLARGRALFAGLRTVLATNTTMATRLEELRWHSQALEAHMQAMALGDLCSRCAARPGGGCCSAYMAGNCDSLLILLNLLLGSEIDLQPDSGENCCFLGPRGCLFVVKPIFCLNYNCSHILNNAEPAQLATLYQCSGAVLSRQTALEEQLVEVIRRHWDQAAPLIGMDPR
jgi:hypothetical protein